MLKICWANTESFADSDFVIIGVPDESKSHALRKGTAEAPNKIREISLTRDKYKRANMESVGFPMEGITRKVFDYGNIEKNLLGDLINSAVEKSKIPFVLGGDHSITTEVLKSISKVYGPISLVYFDAHPDFIATTRNYYGSVLFDSLPYIDLKTSIQIGIRTPEMEEIEKIKQHKLSIITPFDLIKFGMREIENKILKTIGKNVYISIDMDAIDPAFAPGVSTPVPMGLGNNEITYLLKSISKKGIVGIDLMEVCPGYDIKDRTSHLASRMIGEVISSSNLK